MLTIIMGTEPGAAPAQRPARCPHPEGIAEQSTAQSATEVMASQNGPGSSR